MDLYAKRVFDLDTENAFRVGPHIAKLEAAGFKVIKLNLGEPDFNIPDFVKAKIKAELDANNTHYCDPKGIPALRKAIADQISSTRNIKVSPEQVVVFPGAKPAIGFSQEVYCNPGDEIIYPSPGFPIYESFVRYIGAIPKPMHMLEKTNFQVDIEEFSRLISPKTKLIFLNFPSNPTGTIASQEELQKIAAIILERCPETVRVFSDEIYENIIFDGKKHYSIASIPGMEKRTIISSGFSKTYAWTGGRIGYAVLPTIEEADIFKNMNINYFSCVTPYNQEGARIALEHKDAKAEIKKMVEIFQSRRDALVAALRKIPGLSCQTPSGAFYVFPNIALALENLGLLEAYKTLPEDLKSQTSPCTIFRMFALYHHKVAFMDRRSFGKIGSENQHFIRISAAQDIEVLMEGVKRLEAALLDKKGLQEFMKAGENFY